MSRMKGTQNVVHHEEKYVTLRKKALVTPATTWMDPEDAVPRERGRGRRDRHCSKIPLTPGPRAGGVLETEQAVAARGWGGARV